MGNLAVIFGGYTARRSFCNSANVTDPPMKKQFHLLLIISGIAVFAAGTTTLLAAKEEKAAAIGSIRPVGKVAPVDLPALAKISFQHALDAALAKAPGRVIKAELEVEDGNLMYSFEIVSVDRKLTEVEIDAGNGTVLDTENEETGNEAKTDRPGKK